jgi:glyoxylate reductase
MDSKFKVVVMSPWTYEVLREWTDIEIQEKTELVLIPRDAEINQIKGMVADSDIIVGDFSFHFPVTREIIESAKKCKLIHQPSVGYDHIDIEAAREHNIPVTNNAGMNSIAVAEHGIMMMLSLLKKTTWMNEETHNCNWMFIDAVSKGLIWELGGRTVGLVGLGRTGIELVKRLRAFTSSILYFKRNRLPITEEAELGVSYRTFQDLLKESDIISLHIPLTNETRNLIGTTELSMMKPDAILLNLSRGGIVDYHALADALKSGHLSGAGIDVYDPEPIQHDCPLIGLRNVILTPHIAGATHETKGRGRAITNMNMKRILKGKTPINIVNS